MQSRRAFQSAKWILGGATLFGSPACNAYDAPIDPVKDCTDCVPCPECDANTRKRLIVPVDERPAVTAPVRPPPVSGGTLLLTADATKAIVADPDRDRIVIVDAMAFAVHRVVSLSPGDEPGRLVEDASGRVYVALRGSGEVARLDLEAGTVAERRAVCREPRGLAVHPDRASLLVACAEGTLVRLGLQDGSVEKHSLGPDLRDVVVRGSDVYVTRFRSAGIEKLSPTLSIEASGRAPTIATPSTSPTPNVVFESAVAWRAVSDWDGVTVVHQRASTAVVDTDPHSGENGPISVGSPYGGGACDGIVETAVTTMDREAVVRTYRVAGTVLPVDIAVSPRNDLIAIASAGMHDPAMPRQQILFESFGDSGLSGGAASGPGFGPASSLVLLSKTGPLSRVDCVFPNSGPFVAEPIVAVAFDASGRLFAQQREPSRLLLVAEPQFGAFTTLDLGGESRLDTGHELFHRDGGAGIACASCHPEGSEDGRVWSFSNIGVRRTQALNVGLEGTAPFHWDGDLPDVGALMTEVFVERMGGAQQTPARLDALKTYMFAFRPPAAVRPSEDAAAQRGRALFESTNAACATCHSGAKLTNNQTVGVGKGPAVQVPSLLGISRRAPFLHDGCAPTLAARFDPACGGTDHGDVSAFSPGELDDLVAYLETL